MATTVVEKFNSRPIEKNLNGSKSTELVYDIRGTDDEATALSALQSTAPYYTTVDGENIPIIGYKLVRFGPGMFEGIARYEVSYTQAKIPEASTIRYSFDTTGEVQRITQATKVNVYGLTSSTPPDCGDLIEVEMDQNGYVAGVAGCNVTVPTYKWQEATVYHFTNSTAFDDFKITVKGLTGCYNNASFRGFAAGEVLFLGATGTGNMRKNPDATFDMEITLHFAQSDNLSGATIAGAAGVSKLGWDYLWVLSRANQSDKTKPEVLGVYVNRPYSAGDFTDLDIV